MYHFRSARIETEDILQKLQKLEEKVNQLETRVSSRKGTQKLQVDGRILVRFSQTQDIDEAGGKSIYGDFENGIRKARVRFHGKLNKKLSYMIHIRADRGSKVELWDAYVKNLITFL
ncbi:MAG: hypothetical protein ABGX27_01575 [Desulfurobacteriaceae bacterium]